MKKLFSFLALALCAVWGAAQTELPHLEFMGVPIEGNITQFTKQMQPRYKLQKRVGGENYYIYKGPVCGHEMYLKADYSRKTRTVYKVTVTPKFIDQNAFLDSLTVRYGESERTEKGYRWAFEPGEIFLYTPEGYDPVLIYIDRQGTMVMREEK